MAKSKCLKGRTRHDYINSIYEPCCRFCLKSKSKIRKERRKNEKITKTLP